MTAASSNGRTVPALARVLAGRLSALFERDVEIVGRLNDAQRRLQSANERLWWGCRRTRSVSSTTAQRLLALARSPR
jgi:hypothetical protein